MTPLNKMPRMFTEVEGILCLSVSLSSSRSPLCLERRRHISFSSFKEMHIGDSEVVTWVVGLKGPDTGEKKKKRAELQSWENDGHS